jgi:hypothetical protein
MVRKEPPGLPQREFIRQADSQTCVSSLASRPYRGCFLRIDEVLGEYQGDSRSNKKLAVVLAGGGARGSCAVPDG